MVSANFKWAVLSALAKRPDRRATLEEIRREAGTFIASMDQSEPLRRLAALDDVDIFQSGLASCDEAGLQITGAGLALLRSLEGPGEPSSEVFLTPVPPSLRLIDDLIGTEERLKIFDLGLRSQDASFDEDAEDDRPAEEQEQSTAIETADANSEALAIDVSEVADAQTPEVIDDGNHHQPSPDGDDQTTAIAPAEDASQEAPAFLRRSFGSRDHKPSRKSSQLSNFVGTKTRSVLEIWRRHFVKDNSNQKTERPVGGAGGAAFALLSLLMVVTCVGVAITLGQIRSLKSEIATLQRELLPVRERLARLEQAETAKANPKQQADAQDHSETRKSKTNGDIPTGQTTIDLSPEEIQLIKEYIKPAPYAGPPAPAINVGDPVTGAMIPLPSELTDKVPKLLGGKFTTRNGTIIIVRRNSQRADAVLPPR